MLIFLHRQCLDLDLKFSTGLAAETYLPAEKYLKAPADTKIIRKIAHLILKFLKGFKDYGLIDVRMKL